MKAAAAILAKAQITDTEKLVAARRARKSTRRSGR